MEKRKVSTVLLVVILLSVDTPICGHSKSITKGEESLYLTYKLIQDTVRSQPLLTFKLQLAFFPVMNYRYWQVDGAEVIPIDVCVTFYDSTQSVLQQNTSATTGEEMANNSTCWSFQWTNSLLMNIIPGDILLAMDSNFANLFYSNIVESSQNRRLKLNLDINTTSIHDNHSLDDYEQALALFLIAVSKYKGVCINRG